VPITDRRAVLKAIGAVVTSGADTLTALRAARLRLAPALPGTGPGTRREQLPAALESAVAQRLTEDSAAGRPVWQAPLAETFQLAGQLRDYFSSLPDGTAVVVRDPSARFLVTRLLSGARLQCHVLAEDELETAGRPLADAVSASAEEPAR
jgi:hypothetical protein